MRKIVLTGGGTAGHCIPNLALIPYLNKHFDKIYYLGSEKGIERSLVEKAKIEYKIIPCVKLKRKITLSNVKIPFVLYRSIKTTRKILSKIKPDIIFSKGGYVSVPVVIAAKKLNIPVVLHESDITLGLANKIAARYSKFVLTSFPQTAKKIKNGIYVGPPLNTRNLTIDSKNELSKLGFSNQKPVLLITGGSQGAKTINDQVRKILPDLLKDFNIIHLCGKNNVDNSIVIDGYIQKEFSDNMNLLYNISDLCISRAGSNTLFELLCHKLPSLIIPLPKSISRGDQIKNAQYFYKLGLINLLYQENCNSLLKEIQKTYNNRLIYIKNIEKNPIKNSCEQISRIIWQVANGKD